jgi:hypothetical protein
VNLADNKLCYSKQDADLRNELISECFEACNNEGIDIYDVMLEVTLIETGMDKFIPLPSNISSVNS